MFSYSNSQANLQATYSSIALVMWNHVPTWSHKAILCSVVVSTLAQIMVRLPDKDIEFMWIFSCAKLGRQCENGKYQLSERGFVHFPELNTINKYHLRFFWSTILKIVNARCLLPIGQCYAALAKKFKRNLQIFTVDMTVTLVM